MKRAVVSVMTTMLLVGMIVISAPAKAMPRVEAIRVDNWDAASGHDWRGFIRVWSSVANKFWRATGHLDADSWDTYHFSVWLHVPNPTATVHWLPHCSLA